MNKPRLLLVGDFAKHSGFARVNESLAWHLRDRWDIAVLGVNYHGDYTPHQRHYRLYPAWIGGDAHGHGRIAKIVEYEQPDVVLVVADPWHAGGYIEGLTDALETIPPCVLYTPVDAECIRRTDVETLDWYRTVVAYTQFGAQELRRAGVTAPLAIIPHGIDRGLFQPIGRSAARQAAGVPEDWYIVLIVDRNQVRKRLDIAFDAFAQFAAGKPEARLHYHGAAYEDVGWDILAMAADLGIADKLILTDPAMQPLAGIPPQQLPVLYSMADVKLSTTSGEGWGLTTMEAMACGVPCIAPNFAALGEWARPALGDLPATIATRHAKINTVGRVPSTTDVIDALEYLYANPGERQALAAAGLALVSDPAYDWANIADQFDTLLRRAIWHGATVAEYAAQPAEVTA